MTAPENDKTPLERAAERIEGLAGRAIDVLAELLEEAEDERVRLQAAGTLLDRAGLGARNRLELQGRIETSHQLDVKIEGLLQELASKRGAVLDAVSAPIPLPPAAPDGDAGEI